jgi:hypothetical protein
MDKSLHKKESGGLRRTTMRNAGHQRLWKNFALRHGASLWPLL